MLKVLQKQTKIKLSILLLFTILIFGFSPISFAKGDPKLTDPAASGIEGFIFYQLPKYEKPLLIGSALAKPIYYSIRDQFFPKELPGLSQELYTNSIAPDASFRINYLELDVHPGSNDNTTATASGHGPGPAERREDSLPAPNSSQALAGESNHTTTTNSTVTDENFEEPTGVNETSGSEVDFLNLLPDELGLLILDHLSLEDRCNSALVSREWNNIVNDNISWAKRSRLDFSKENIDTAIRSQISHNSDGTLNWKKIYEICWFVNSIATGGIINDFARVERVFNLAFNRRLASANIYESYIVAVGRTNNFVQAQRAFNLAEEKGLVDVNIYVAYMVAAGRTYNFTEAQRVFNLMQEINLVDADIYVHYINRIGWINANFAEMQRVFNLAQENGLVNADIFIAYLGVAGMCDNIKEAQRGFKLVQESGLLDANIYSAYISMCGSRIVDSGIDFNERRYIVIHYAANLEEARRAFNLAHESGLVNIDIYASYLEIVSMALDAAEEERVYKLALAENLDDKDILALDIARSRIDDY